MRENTSPEKVVQFSDLYTKLLTQPVLSQKWAILYLLHQLADSGFADEQTIRLPASQHNVHISPQRNSTATHDDPQAPQRKSYQPAFSNDVSAALSKLPTRQIDPRAKTEDRDYNERKSGANTEKTLGPTIALETMSGSPELGMPSEAALLRDLPFTLQGLSSTNLPFTSLLTLSLPPTLPLPIISLLHTLAEPSLLYRSLSEFVQSRNEGLVGQSLRSAVGSELRSYLGLIATLEGEIRRAITSLDVNEARGSISKAGVTLKRCVVWTRDSTMGLRLMSLIVEEAKSKSQ